MTHVHTPKSTPSPYYPLGTVDLKGLDKCIQYGGNANLPITGQGQDTIYIPHLSIPFISTQVHRTERVGVDLGLGNSNRLRLCCVKVLRVQLGLPSGAAVYGTAVLEASLQIRVRSLAATGRPMRRCTIGPASSGLGEGLAGWDVLVPLRSSDSSVVSCTVFFPTHWCGWLLG